MTPEYITEQELIEARSLYDLQSELTAEIGNLNIQLRNLEIFRKDLQAKLDDTFATLDSAVSKNKQLAIDLEQKYGQNRKIDLETGQIN